MMSATKTKKSKDVARETSPDSGAYTSHKSKRRRLSTDDEEDSGSPKRPTNHPTSKLGHNGLRSPTFTPHNKPAELFRKDLISAMKLADSEPLQQDYIFISDPWRQEWEKGVQVPVNPGEIPDISIKTLYEKPITGDFKIPRKYLHATQDETFRQGIHELTGMQQLSEQVVRYDLDDLDVSWLELANEEREEMGLLPVHEWTMERVIEAFESQCHEKIKEIMKTEEGLGIEYDEDIVCEVCRSPDSEETNEMVFCDGCDICVHQACYGIQNIPEGRWLCRTCSLGIKPTCILCPKTGGAMKSTKSGTKWAHVSCALWIPEVSIGCVEKMEPITKISNIPASRWALVCCVCKDRVGACIQCSVKTCKTAFHVTCAIFNGLEMKTILDESDEQDGVKLKAFCPRHSKKRERSQSDSEPDSPRKDAPLTPRKDLSKEEVANLRAKKMSELQNSFYNVVDTHSIAVHLSVEDEVVEMMEVYWKLKRKSNFDKPLLMPKTEEADMLEKQQEDSLVARMKMFVHLRQDLERVRNLCYMISRREKTKRQYYKARESTFLATVHTLTEEKLNLSAREAEKIAKKYTKNCLYEGYASTDKPRVVSQLFHDHSILSPPWLGEDSESLDSDSRDAGGSFRGRLSSKGSISGRSEKDKSEKDSGKDWPDKPGIRELSDKHSGKDRTERDHSEQRGKERTERRSGKDYGERVSGKEKSRQPGKEDVLMKSIVNKDSPKIQSEKSGKEKVESVKVHSEKLGKEKDSLKVYSEKSGKEKDSLKVYSEKLGKEKDSLKAYSEKSGKEKDSLKVYSEKSGKEKVDSVKVHSEKSGKEKDSLKVYSEKSGKESLKVLSEKSGKESLKVPSEKSGKEKSEGEKIYSEKSGKEKMDNHKGHSEKFGKEKVERRDQEEKVSRREKYDRQGGKDGEKSRERHLRQEGSDSGEKFDKDCHVWKDTSEKLLRWEKPERRAVREPAGDSVKIKADSDSFEKEVPCEKSKSDDTTVKMVRDKSERTRGKGKEKVEPLSESEMVDVVAVDPPVVSASFHPNIETRVEVKPKVETSVFDSERPRRSQRENRHQIEMPKVDVSPSRLSIPDAILVEEVPQPKRESRKEKHRRRGHKHRRGEHRSPDKRKDVTLSLSRDRKKTECIKPEVNGVLRKSSKYIVDVSVKERVQNKLLKSRKLRYMNGVEDKSLQKLDKYFQIKSESESGNTKSSLSLRAGNRILNEISPDKGKVPFENNLFGAHYTPRGSLSGYKIPKKGDSAEHTPQKTQSPCEKSEEQLEDSKSGETRSSRKKDTGFGGGVKRDIFATGFDALSTDSEFTKDMELVSDCRGYRSHSPLSSEGTDVSEPGRRPDSRESTPRRVTRSQLVDVDENSVDSVHSPRSNMKIRLREGWLRPSNFAS
ncbi:protein Jade-3-like [Haliotis cracherodii]|uniref:protein Jade-3-like n=1 Tax=Haliotis cracherodii TaxID=6455 RepID=UPI0039EB1429